MRLTAILFAVFLATAPAQAQSWQEYTYPGYSFGLSFPVEPKVETTTYQAPDGRMVSARVYSASEHNAVYTMTVADLSGSTMEENVVLDHAVKTLAAGGAIKLDIPHRISRVYGRQLSIAGADGTQSSIAVFFYKQRLYQIEGKALPGGEDGTGSAIRFQQSLIFTDDLSNRSTAARIRDAIGQLF